jgi:hypothetical protein
MQLGHSVPGSHKVNYEAQGFSPNLFNLSCRFYYFHSIMEFVIIFWGISVKSKQILLQQKKDN